MKFCTIIFVFMYLSSGCASIHSGQEAEVLGEKPSDTEGASNRSLKVTSQEVESLSSKYFGAIEFTFENLTSEWVRVQSVEITFGNQQIDSQIEVPVGSELNSWAIAAKQNRDIDDFNRSLILSSIAGIGAATAVTSSKSNAGPAAALALSAGAMLSIDSFKDKSKRITAANILPDDHLMAKDFVIPPGLHAKRWIVVYTPKPNDMPLITAALMSLHDGKETTKFKVPFRSLRKSNDSSSKITTYYLSSKWQNKNNALKAKNITTNESLFAK